MWFATKADALAPDAPQEAAPEPQIIPRNLGIAGHAVADGVAMSLRALRVSLGRDAADDMAAGYCEGAARYWHDEDAPIGFGQQAAE